MTSTVNEDRLLIGRQRYLWFILFAEKCVGMQVKLWDFWQRVPYRSASVIRFSKIRCVKYWSSLRGAVSCYFFFVLKGFKGRFHIQDVKPLLTHSLHIRCTLRCVAWREIVVAGTNWHSPALADNRFAERCAAWHAASCWRNHFHPWASPIVSPCESGAMLHEHRTTPADPVDPVERS